MAPTPEQIKLDADLQLLISIKFETMPLAQQLQLQKEMATIKDEYDNAKEMAARAEKGSRDEKYYNAVGEAIAKSVQAIVRGALSANAAFKKGDNIAGSAAIMDICASVIPAL